MAPVRNGAAIYKKVPETYPVPGETIIYEGSGTIDLDNVELNGGILVKVLYLSMDPYMRDRMRDPKIESYLPPFVPDEPLSGFGVGVVLRSESNEYKKGDHIHAAFLFQEYMVFPPTLFQPFMVRALPENTGIPLPTWLGLAGMTGMTAWLGYKSFAKPQKGETIYVSTAAGAVGSVVCQLAKLDGLKVIGSTGSDEKVKYLLEELKIDAAFNYKKESPTAALKKYGPIDIFWDHVGGEGFDAAIENMNNFGRIISCGWAAGYNGGDPYGGVKNLYQLSNKSLSVNGFIVNYLLAKVGDLGFAQAVPPLVAEGKLKTKDYVVEGLDQAGQLILDVMTGANDGKAILKVASG